VNRTAWLIERNVGRGAEWLRIIPNSHYNFNLTASLAWGENAGLALQFSRKSDAEDFAFLHAEIGPLCTATEHVFVVVPK
jgi:hypothetical protein